MAWIFKITDPENRVYIGRTVNLEKRLKVIRYPSTIEKYIHLRLSFEKHGFENHTVELIEESKDNYRERHQYWISYYVSNGYKFISENGLNCTDGGAGSGAASEERKRKISEANTGRSHSAKLRKQMRDRNIKNRKKLTKKDLAEIQDAYEVKGHPVKTISEDFGISNGHCRELIVKYNWVKPKIQREVLTNKVSAKHGRIIDIVTGKVYPNINLAADAIGINYSVLLRYLKGAIHNHTNMRFLDKENPSLVKRKKYNIGKKYVKREKVIEAMINLDVETMFSFLQNEYINKKFYISENNPIFDAMEKIEYTPNFLKDINTEGLFDVLSGKHGEQIKWHDELTNTDTGTLVKIKRKMAYVSDVDSFTYNYAKLSFPGQTWPTVLQGIRDMVNEFTGREFNSVLLNWYKDGKDIIGWHSDKEDILKGGLEGSVIACVNLGATRNFLFRKKDSDEAPIVYPVADGDLLMMNAGCQAEYLHAILKEAGVTEPRISLTFREANHEKVAQD